MHPPARLFGPFFVIAGTLHFADGLHAGEVAGVLELSETWVRERMRRQRLDLDEIGLAAARVSRQWRAEESQEGPKTTRRAAGLFTLGEVAKICGVASRTAAKWCDAGLLASYRLPQCNHRRIQRHHLAQFLATRQIPSQRPDLYPGTGNG